MFAAGVVARSVAVAGFATGFRAADFRIAVYGCRAGLRSHGWRSSEIDDVVAVRWPPNQTTSVSPVPEHVRGIATMPVRPAVYRVAAMHNPAAAPPQRLPAVRHVYCRS